MDRLKGRTALVTGAASGIGLGIVRRFAEEGAAVVITDIAADAGETAAESIRQQGGQALFLPHDAGDEADWRRVVDQTIAAFGKLDVLVNNAYSGAVHSLGDASLEDQLEGFRVTTHGVFLGLKLAAPRMSDGGAIVNISSIAGYRASSGNAVYSAAKSAARALSRAAALDLAPRGIRVNIVAPGVVMTPSLTSTVKTLFKTSSEQGVSAGLERLKATVPLRRIAEPREIANAVLFLVSDEASFITGADLMVDGGAMLQ